MRRGKLLTGVAAMVALSVAGPGCRTSELGQSHYPPSGEVATAQGGEAQDGGRPARISFPIRTRAASSQTGAAAVMLRPVPLGMPAEATAGGTSTWAPVQRVAGEMPETQEAVVTRAASLGSPLPANVMTSTQAPAGGPLLPVSPTPTLVGTAPDVGEGKEKLATLPMPRVSGVNKNMGAVGGYPAAGPGFPQPPAAPREFEMRALSEYIVEPPDILLVELYLPALRRTTIRAEQLVRPDGTIGFSSFPPVYVAGLTLEQIKRRLAETILPHIKNIEGRDDEKNRDPVTLDSLLGGLKVDVLRYNSKFFYVITDGGGYGEQVTQVPLTGNERVLDAVAKIQGLPAVSSKKQIWLARATPDHGQPNIMPVDWCGIVQRGQAATNYQMFPGDRLYINSDKRIRTDSWLAKTLAPVERVLGVTLLGSSVVNSIKNGTSNNSGLGGFGR